MIIYINSSPRDIPENCRTVGNLLDFLNIKRGGTGIGLNNRLVPSREWDSTFLKNEDRVMIISAAYGG